MTDVRVSQDPVEVIAEETAINVRNSQNPVEVAYRNPGDIHISQNAIEVFEHVTQPIRLSQMALEVIFKDSGNFINIFVVT